MDTDGNLISLMDNSTDTDSTTLTDGQSINVTLDPYNTSHSKELSFGETSSVLDSVSTPLTSLGHSDSANNHFPQTDDNKQTDLPQNWSIDVSAK